MDIDHCTRYRTKLAQLGQKNRLRTLNNKAGIDFSSNDYLGLASSSEMHAALLSAVERGVAVGAGGSRLLRGNHPEHEALEEEASAFFGCERMLYFNSGYSANIAALSTLPQRGDLVIYDNLIHASAHEGMKAGRAEATSVPHNNSAAVEDAIRTWRNTGGRGAPWIVVESLYSMDGDRSALSDLIEIADHHNGFLFIDEAHATGVHGKLGVGYCGELKKRENVIVLHTCGKALGVAGALLGGSRLICDYLINKARPFIYSTAPSPVQAACVRQALHILANEPKRRNKLHELINHANAEFFNHFGKAGSETQILPVIIGNNDSAVRIANRLQSRGFDIRAIRPPTVPIGTARVRITITLNVNKSDITQMMAAVAETIEEENHEQKFRCHRNRYRHWQNNLFGGARWGA